MRGASSRRLISVFAIFLALPPVTLAQTGSLIVEVRDENGQPLRDAMVFIGDPNDSQSGVIASDDGLAKFPVLRPIAPGNEGYVLTIWYPDYEDVRITDVRVLPGKTKRLVVYMPVSRNVWVMPSVKLDCDGIRVPVVRVVDGSSLVVAFDDRNERVRLLGVDTPEFAHWKKRVEYLGREAMEFTRSLAEGVTLCLEPEPGGYDRESYGRLLRYVYLPDGRLLNALIIYEGYGLADPKYPFSKLKEFRWMEGEAWKAGRGLWAERTESSGCYGNWVPILRVVDGNTLVVELDDSEKQVRLLGVTAPEQDAAEFAWSLVEGVTVCLEPEPGRHERESEDRLLRYVYLPDGRLLNALIIKAGYGRVDGQLRFSKKGEFQYLEDEALHAGRGLWAENEP